MMWKLDCAKGLTYRNSLLHQWLATDTEATLFSRNGCRFPNILRSETTPDRHSHDWEIRGNLRWHCIWSVYYGPAQLSPLRRQHVYVLKAQADDHPGLMLCLQCGERTVSRMSCQIHRTGKLGPNVAAAVAPAHERGGKRVLALTIGRRVGANLNVLRPNHEQ